MELALKIVLFVLIIMMAICVLMIIWNLKEIIKCNEQIIALQKEELKIREEQIGHYEKAIKCSDDLIAVQKGYINYLKGKAGEKHD